MGGIRFDLAAIFMIVVTSIIVFVLANAGRSQSFCNQPYENAELSGVGY